MTGDDMKMLLEDLADESMHLHAGEKRKSELERRSMSALADFHRKQGGV